MEYQLLLYTIYIQLEDFLMPLEFQKILTILYLQIMKLCLHHIESLFQTEQTTLKQI